MKHVICLAILLGLAIPSWAEAPQIFGYFEPQMMGAYIDEDVQSLFSNKLRVDLEALPARGVKVGANINYFTYTGQTSYNILDYLPADIRSDVTPGTEEVYRLTYEDSLALDNAYVRLSFSKWDLTVGKQQISYGTGYAWNPTDLFNKKDLLDPTYEQPGQNAVRLDLPLHRDLSLVALYSPGEEWDRPTALLRAKTHFGGYDFSLTGITTEWTYTTYPSFQSTTGWRRMVGGDLVGQLLGLGVWGEAAYNDLEYTTDFWEALVGCDYTLRSGLYLLGEVYYHSEAPESSDEYTLTHWMQYISGETRTLGQAQAYLFAQYPATDWITVGGSLITCLSDQSYALVPQIIYLPFQDVELTAFGNLYVGEEGSMFAEDFGNGGMLRLRVYF